MTHKKMLVRFEVVVPKCPFCYNVEKQSSEQVCHNGINIIQGQHQTEGRLPRQPIVKYGAVQIK